MRPSHRGGDTSRDSRTTAREAAEDPCRIVSGRPARADVDVDGEFDHVLDQYTGCDDVVRGAGFDDYGHAYGVGSEAYDRDPARDFDDVEAELASDWPTRRGVSGSGWDRAQHAVRDAWQRVIGSR